MATLKVGDIYTVGSIGTIRSIASDPAAGTTQTLEENYWYTRGGREYEIRTLHADTVERWYNVPKRTYNTLKPSIADTYYGDSYQIVANVRRQDQSGRADNCWMIVTYVKLTNNGWDNGYAETRRRRVNGKHDTVYETYGIASSITQAGIPAKGDYLDIDDWVVTHGTYSVGDYAVNDSQLYICTVEHTAAADKEPPNASYWQPSIEAPICLEVERDDKVYAGLILIRARWSEYLRYSTGHNAAIADFELIRDSRSEHWRGKNYRGLRKFLIPNSLVNGYRDDFKPDDGNVWPGTASTWDVNHGTYNVGDLVQGDGSPDSYIYKCTVQHTAAAGKEPPNTSYWTRVKYAAYVHEHNEEREAVPNHTLVTSYYYRPTTSRLLIDNAGNGHSSGKMILEVWSDPSAMVVRKDPADNMVQGQDPDHPEERYVVVDGAGLQLRPREKVRLTTVAVGTSPSTIISAIRPLLWHYNNATMSNIGSASAKTMLLVGYYFDIDMVEEEAVKVIYEMWYNSAGWDVAMSVRKQELDFYTTDSGRDVPYYKWSGAAVDRDPTLGSADFSAWNTMLAW